jgi:hypothetical protein
VEGNTGATTDEEAGLHCSALGGSWLKMRLLAARLIVTRVEKFNSLIQRSGSTPGASLFETAVREVWLDWEMKVDQAIFDFGMREIFVTTFAG